MKSRQQRRAEERLRKKSETSYSVQSVGKNSDVSMDEVLAIMTGNSSDRREISLDEIPEKMQSEFKQVAKQLEDMGEGPVRFFLKSNGDYSVMGSPRYHGPPIN